MLVCVMVVLTSTTVWAWAVDHPQGSADPDGDLLTNKEEFKAGTNPIDADTDGGGCWDGWEVFYGLNATDPEDDLFDTDDNGWSNEREFLEGTNPLDPNTDGDRYPLDSADPNPLMPNSEDDTPPDGNSEGVSQVDHGERSAGGPPGHRHASDHRWYPFQGREGPAIGMPLKHSRFL